MPTTQRPRPWQAISATTLTCAALASLLACGSDAFGPSSSVRVNVRTSGAAPDPDGYTVQLGSAPSRRAGVNDSLIFTGVADGSYTLLLAGIAANCAVSGANPRSLIVRGTGVSVTFDVTCGDSGAGLPPSPPPPPPGGSTISISPTSVAAGSPDLTVTISGYNFAGRPHFSSHVIWWVGNLTYWLATTYVNHSQLTAVIPARFLRTPDSAQVFVLTGDLMGDVPLVRSGTASFTVTPSSEWGTIIIHGLVSTLGPRMKGFREVSLDGLPWRVLREADSLFFRPVSVGDHELLLSNPCTSDHEPTTKSLTVAPNDTVVVGVPIPPNCQ